jgi:hypothetical protein
MRIPAQDEDTIIAAAASSRKVIRLAVEMLGHLCR